MGTPYLGQILLVGFNFNPPGYLKCDGQLLSISQNEALFALLGTTYGGDGQSTFAVPDLRGRVPIHAGQGPGLSNYVLGQLSGSENVTLTSQQMPIHSHPAACVDVTGDSTTASGNYFSGGPPTIFAPPGALTPMGSAVSLNGNNQLHSNLQPYLTLNYIIATEGIFPSRN